MCLGGNNDENTQQRNHRTWQIASSCCFCRLPYQAISKQERAILFFWSKDLQTVHAFTCLTAGVEEQSYQQLITSSTGILCTQLVNFQKAYQFFLNLQVVFNYVDNCSGSKVRKNVTCLLQLTTHVPLSCQNTPTCSNRSNIPDKWISKE